MVRSGVLVPRSLSPSTGVPNLWCTCYSPQFQNLSNQMAKSTHGEIYFHSRIILRNQNPYTNSTIQVLKNKLLEKISLLLTSVWFNLLIYRIPSEYSQWETVSLHFIVQAFTIFDSSVLQWGRLAKLFKVEILVLFKYDFWKEAAVPRRHPVCRKMEAPHRERTPLLYTEFKFLWTWKICLSRLTLNYLSIKLFTISGRYYNPFTPTLAGFEILNDATLIIQNWPFSRVFPNIIDYLKFA